MSLFAPSSFDPAAMMDDEANIFAAYLLMPPELFDPILQNGFSVDDDRALERVAKKFRVPMGAVIFRVFLAQQEASI